MRRYVASDLKDMNRRTVYNLLASEKEISRAEISRRTGISSPTVIKIINHFKELGFISFEGEGESKVGRKPQIVRFNQTAACSIGVDFEGDHLMIGIVDLLGHILNLKKFTVVPDFVSTVREKLGTLIEQVIEQTDIKTNRIIGVGIGVPGSVSLDLKTVRVAPLVGIKKQLDVTPLLAELESRLKLPVKIEKDVNAAALGEFVHRRNPACQDLIYISLGTGVGAGIILDGRLRRGTNSLAGEIGYLSFDVRASIDPGAPGWLESRIGYKTFAKNPNPRAVIKKIVNDLALAIAGLSIALDVDQVVVGGIGFESLGNTLLEILNEKLARLCLRPVHCLAPVCPEPVVVGAAWIITEDSLAKLLDGSDW